MSYALFRNGDENGKVDRNPNLHGPHPHQKLISSSDW